MHVRAVAGLTLLAMLLGGATVAQVVAAATASAHAELASSNPAAGARVEALPDVARLTFTEAVGQPAALSVTGPDGSEVTTGSVDVVDTVLTRPLDTEVALTDGDYTISYQVTSADGHPIAGAVDFTVVADGAAADPAPAADSAQAADPGQSAGTGGGLSTGVVVALVAALLAALGVAVLSIRRLVGRAPDG